MVFDFCQSLLYRQARLVFSYFEVRFRSRRDSKVLDVGCGSKPYAGLFGGSDYLGIDIEAGYWKDEQKKADLYFDGENIFLPDASFDVVVCTEVLEHAANPDKLMLEINRVLKVGGVLFISVPFVWNEHESPYDFRRYTKYGLEKTLLANGFLVDSIEPTSGPMGAIGQLVSAFIFEHFKIGGSIAKLILTLLILTPIQLVSIFLDRLFPKKWLSLSYVAIAKKYR